MPQTKGIFSQCVFCPKCGVKSLERDDYKQGRKRDGYPEFICLTCGFGFVIHPSTRHKMAEGLFRDHRRMREGKT